jgi:hypothetical protein
MAVAKSQIEELLLAMLEVMEREEVIILLNKLRDTIAYQRNDSFATTIERLSQEIGR